MPRNLSNQKVLIAGATGSALLMGAGKALTYLGNDDTLIGKAASQTGNTSFVAGCVALGVVALAGINEMLNGEREAEQSNETEQDTKGHEGLEELRSLAAIRPGL